MAATPLVYSRFKAPDAPGGTVDVYQAGSLQNRKTTYSDPGLTSANTNPVVLDSLGEADIFYTGLARIVIKKSSGSQVSDKDNIGLSGDTSTQYVNSLSATYGSSTTFTLSGDQTTEYHVNRIVRLTGSTTAYGRITASSYSNPTTTVTVVLTSGTLDATLASAATSLLAANSTSGATFSHVQGSDVASVAGATVLDTVIGDYCNITGTEAITSFTLTKGRHMFVKAGGAFSMTHGASLILPGAANITAASGDTFLLAGEASGVVRCLFYWPTAVSVPEVSALDGITATASELNITDVSANAVANYSAGALEYWYTGNDAVTGFDVVANVTENTFESVGPTGSSATNIYATMDVIPVGATAAIFGASLFTQTTSASTIHIYGRITGSTEAALIGSNSLASCSSLSADGGESILVIDTALFRVPLDASRRFDITWTAGNDSSRGCTIYLRGWVK